MSAPLTRRQAEVLDHLCSGLTNKEIGRAMGVTQDTIKGHMSLAMQKLGGRTRAQTAVIWMQARPDYVTLWQGQDEGVLVDLPDAVVASPSAQFWSFVRRQEGCWIWEGALYGGRTPHCSLPGFEEIGPHARRIAYALERGERVPEGQRIAMTCSVVRCVSPDHMRVVSVQNRPHFDRVFGRKVVEGKGSRKEDD